MNIVSISNADVNFSLFEDALPDTFRYRQTHRKRFADDLILQHNYNADLKRIWKDFDLNNDVTVAVDGYHPTETNQYRGFFDVEVSIAKYLFDGDNSKGYKRQYDYLKNYNWNFNILQGGIRANTGLPLKLFDCRSSRLHIALNFDCYTPENAIRVRDFLFKTVTIPHLPNKYPPIGYPVQTNTRYWNCRSYKPDDDYARRTHKDGSLIQSNKTLAIYTNGRYLRVEIRFNNAAAVRGLMKSSLAKRLKLENNFKSLSQPKNMNEIFWHTAIHLFNADDRGRIKKHYSLLDS